CTASYTITQADLDAGSLTNHATATAKFGANTHTSNQDTAKERRAGKLTKTAAESTYANVGHVIHYSYTVKNVGNVTLSAPYAVSDDKAAASCPSTPATLAPGASVTCTASYTITQADLNAGSVTNHATATAKFGANTVTSNQD